MIDLFRLLTGVVLIDLCLDIQLALFVTRILENAREYVRQCACVLLLFISHQSMINGNGFVCFGRLCCGRGRGRRGRRRRYLPISCMVHMLLLVNDNAFTKLFVVVVCSSSSSVLICLVSFWPIEIFLRARAHTHTHSQFYTVCTVVSLRSPFLYGRAHIRILLCIGRGRPMKLAVTVV